MWDVTIPNTPKNLKLEKIASQSISAWEPWPPRQRNFRILLALHNEVRIDKISISYPADTWRVFSWMFLSLSSNVVINDHATEMARSCMGSRILHLIMLPYSSISTSWKIDLQSKSIKYSLPISSKHRCWSDKLTNPCAIQSLISVDLSIWCISFDF